MTATEQRAVGTKAFEQGPHETRLVRDAGRGARGLRWPLLLLRRSDVRKTSRDEKEDSAQRHRGSWSNLRGLGPRTAGTSGAPTLVDTAKASAERVELHAPRVDSLALADGLQPGDLIERYDGQAVFRQAVRRMAEAARDALDATGLKASDIDWILPHQANARIVTAVAEQVGVPTERAMLDMAETGNTSAASIPITLGRARESGQLAAGQIILMLAFGAGLTWACQVWRVRE